MIGLTVHVLLVLSFLLLLFIGAVNHEPLVHLITLAIILMTHCGTDLAVILGILGGKKNWGIFQNNRMISRNN